MDSLCRVTMFGGVRAIVDGREINKFRTRKTGYLLAYLAIHSDTAIEREKLCDIFWPDLDLENAANNLSTALSSLRSQLEPPGIPAGTIIQSDRLTVRLNPVHVQTDLDEFYGIMRSAKEKEAAAERKELLQSAVKIADNPLLPGCFDEWVQGEQRRARDEQISAYELLCGCLIDLSDWPQVIAITAYGLALDAYNESITRARMRGFAALGNPSASKAAYEDLEQRLAAEIGISPSAQTTSLHTLILADPSAAAVAVSDLQYRPPSVISISKEASATVHRTRQQGPSLPSQLTRFFGREAEIESLSQLLQPTSATESGVRLVNILGPGGSGKTRFAIETAKRVANAFDGRIWFVHLADTPHHRLVPFSIAHALRLPPDSGPESLDQISEFLQGAPALLILDNLEHLLDDLPPHKILESSSVGAALFIRTLLDRCPMLTCLATSRRIIGIGGELQFLLNPLDLPDPDEEPAGIMKASSVALYSDRAALAQPGFAITRNNAATVSELCRKLEGMPLAIEMAAAWAKTVPPVRMLERLNERLSVLAGRRADMPPRQQSLRATFDWSFALLTPEMQNMLIDLSVFRGGWTIESATEICATPEEQTSNLMVTLCDHSLVIAEPHDERPRFRTLETIRAFSLEKLRESGQEAELRSRHAHFFRRWTDSGAAYLAGIEQEQRILRFEEEIENIRAALDWIIDRDDNPINALKFTFSLAYFWQVRGYLREGSTYLRRAVNRPDAYAPTSARADALYGLAVLLGEMSETETVESILSESLAISVSLNDRKGMARCHNNLGNLTKGLGHYERARGHYESALALNQELGRRYGIARNCANLGSLLVLQGNLGAASDYLTQALTIQQETEDVYGIANTLHTLGDISLKRNDSAAARTQLSESLRLKEKLGDGWGMAYTLAAFAALFEIEGKPLMAARFLGTFKELCNMHAARTNQGHTDMAEETSKRVLSILGPAEFHTAFEEGRSLPVESATRMALQG